jgi:hypothetical protein
MGWALSVDKADISKAKLVETDSATLNDGEARLAIHRFAMTANNVTYAAFGEIMRYWYFFPASDGGRLPVWGFAEVVEDKNTGLELGDRIYGYFPASDELIVQPVGVSAGNFTDGAPHRQDLPGVYNRYTRCASDPGYSKPGEATQMVLQPLFITSWLIDLHLRDTDFLGADCVSLTSASSKTALALGFLLSQDKSHGKTVEAMTSQRSKPFVEKTGFYDQITTYDELTTMKPEPKRLVVDFAGNAKINTDIHTTLAYDLAGNIRVGGAHWEDSTPAGDLAGPKPVFFFAPDHIQQRMKAWGPGEFAKRYGAAWMSFAEIGKDLFEEQELSGGNGTLDADLQMVNNTAPASAALTVAV